MLGSVPGPGTGKLENPQEEIVRFSVVTNYSMPDKIMEEIDHVRLLSSSSSSGVTTKSESWIIDSGVYVAYDL